MFIDQNVKTIPWEVPLLELKKRGHRITLLTISDYGPMHVLYKNIGIPVFSMNFTSLRFSKVFNYAYSLFKFSKSHEIDIIHAHFQLPSLVAILIQPLVKLKIVCFRHHYNQNQRKCLGRFFLQVNYIDFIISHFCHKLVVPSELLRNKILRTELIRMNKLFVIPYAYRWEIIANSKNENHFQYDNNELQLLMISRLTVLKRPTIAIDILNSLISLGVKCNLVIAGDGPLRPELLRYIQKNGLSHHVKYMGFIDDVKYLLTNSSLLIHPSITEASSSIVKEAAIANCPVAVCAGVGDFDEYIYDNVNGWRIDPNNFASIVVGRIINTSPNERKIMSSRLKNEVIKRFSLTNDIINSYLNL